MTEETEVHKKSEKPQRAKERPNKRERPKPLTKVVIRRLPPTMTEEEFLKQIDPMPSNEYYYYVAADWSLGHDATCRAYINFTNSDDIFLFKDRFDGYVFVDSKGAEYPAVVEFAPFQGLPRNKSRKKDPKASTIESDPHYQEFLEILSKEEAEGKSEVKLEFSLTSKEDKKITSTPLLQYLANKKQERRDERKRKIEEKRRVREEDKQRKRNQVAKSVPPPIKEEESKASKDSGAKSKEESKKEFKTKRRAERDLKRKLEFDKRMQAIKKLEEMQHEKPGEKSDIPEKGKEKEDEKKKEVKKYSQSRKSRNESKSDTASSAGPEGKESQTAESTTHCDSKESEVAAGNSGEISDSVKEFIKSVANIKEFVPRSRILTNTDLESSIKPGAAAKDVDMSEVRDKLEQIAIAQKDGKADDKHKDDGTKEKSVSPDDSPENGARDSSCSGTDKNDKGKDNRSMRRIRNKDRPSIEIYQPGKLRMKKEDGRDGRSSAELKDYKSNPTSDCESIKKEKDEKENVRKKVSRYSERRSSRAKERLTKDDKQDPELSQSVPMAVEDTPVNKEDSPPVEIASSTEN